MGVTKPARLAIRLTTRVVDAACYPLVLLIRAWDAADAELASRYANGRPEDDL